MYAKIKLFKNHKKQIGIIITIDIIIISYITGFMLAGLFVYTIYIFIKTTLILNNNNNNNA